MRSSGSILQFRGLIYATLTSKAFNTFFSVRIQWKLYWIIKTIFKDDKSLTRIWGWGCVNKQSKPTTTVSAYSFDRFHGFRKFSLKEFVLSVHRMLSIERRHSDQGSLPDQENCFALQEELVWRKKVTNQSDSVFTDHMIDVYLYWLLMKQSKWE